MCISAHVYTCAYMCTHVCSRVQYYAYIYEHVHMSMFFVRMHARCTCVHNYCVCTYMCVHTHVNMYIALPCVHGMHALCVCVCVCVSTCSKRWVGWSKELWSPFHRGLCLGGVGNLWYHAQGLAFLSASQCPHPWASARLRTCSMAGVTGTGLSTCPSHCPFSGGPF